MTNWLCASALALFVGLGLASTASASHVEDAISGDAIPPAFNLGPSKCVKRNNTTLLCVLVLEPGCDVGVSAPTIAEKICVG